MSKIKNIAQLREAAIETFEHLRAGLIEREEAAVMAKLCDTTLSSVKVELLNCAMKKQIPNIEFLDGPSVPVNISHKKLLESK